VRPWPPCKDRKTDPYANIPRRHKRRIDFDGKEELMLLLILGFALGVYVGYKYPQQVEQATEYTKKTVKDLKDKFGKKEAS
jgi:hypothetical protein